MFSKAFSLLFVVMVLASLTSAHFTLDTPESRYFDEEKEGSFCGGSQQPADHRGSFPVAGAAPIWINSHHDHAEVAIILSLNTDPNKFSDFKTNGKFNYLMDFTKISGQDKFCFSVDIASSASQNGFHLWLLETSSSTRRNTCNSQRAIPVVSLLDTETPWTCPQTPFFKPHLQRSLTRRVYLLRHVCSPMCLPPQTRLLPSLKPSRAGSALKLGLG
ncbi:Hypothetical protein MELLADRAFT_123519 [Melampsora larici-populina 98AG31]|uniref:Copper acquisition factor BIM1-like domain-containing protein n=1 Tax=Melampsora larici-populina (strain 98AG31 / pathotype 3-4-7) TaxID=747676 RepID=F4S0H0_MELLP|nr:Hypothetical protein MELLADRAFT_123519 [Melampsora larici-populina 98AG31]EGG01766.1 Hypothetical protein MELLADRAFT_123519 [Melampsora larici-populina 98AG31]